MKKRDATCRRMIRRIRWHASHVRTSQNTAMVRLVISFALGSLLVGGCPRPAVRYITVNHGGDIMAVGAQRRTLARIPEWRGRASSASLSRDGRLAVASYGSVAVHDLEGRLIARVNETGSATVAWSNDGRRLAVANEHSGQPLEVTLYTPALEKVRTFVTDVAAPRATHADLCVVLSWTPDDQRLAVSAFDPGEQPASDDDTAQCVVIDVQTGAMTTWPDTARVYSLGTDRVAALRTAPPRGEGIFQIKNGRFERVRRFVGGRICAGGPGYVAVMALHFEPFTLLTGSATVRLFDLNGASLGQYPGVVGNKAGIALDIWDALRPNEKAAPASAENRFTPPRGVEPLSPG